MKAFKARSDRRVLNGQILLTGGALTSSTFRIIIEYTFIRTKTASSQ
jgi:hypothetical protein